MTTLEDAKFQILAFLYSNKKANAKKLEEHVGCSNKTFLKARQQLEKDGLITKHYEQKPGGGLYAIYQLTPKGISFFLKEMEKREIIKMIDATAPEDIHKIKSGFF